MAASSITLSEELQQLAHSRAAAYGFPDISSYISALIRADAGELISSKLESRLLFALSTPARELSHFDWEAKRRTLLQHRERDTQ